MKKSLINTPQLERNSKNCDNKVPHQNETKNKRNEGLRSQNDQSLHLPKTSRPVEPLNGKSPNGYEVVFREYTIEDPYSHEIKSVQKKYLKVRYTKGPEEEESPLQQKYLPNKENNHHFRKSHYDDASPKDESFHDNKTKRKVKKRRNEIEKRNSEPYSPNKGLFISKSETVEADHELKKRKRIRKRKENVTERNIPPESPVTRDNGRNDNIIQALIHLRNEEEEEKLRKFQSQQSAKSKKGTPKRGQSKEKTSNIIDALIELSKEEYVMIEKIEECEDDRYLDIIISNPSHSKKSKYSRNDNKGKRCIATEPREKLQPIIYCGSSKELFTPSINKPTLESITTQTEDIKTIQVTERSVPDHEIKEEEEQNEKSENLENNENSNILNHSENHSENVSEYSQNSTSDSDNQHESKSNHESEYSSQHENSDYTSPSKNEYSMTQSKNTNSLIQSNNESTSDHSNESEYSIQEKASNSLEKSSQNDGLSTSSNEQEVTNDNKSQSEQNQYSENYSENSEDEDNSDEPSNQNNKMEQSLSENDSSSDSLNKNNPNKKLKLPPSGFNSSSVNRYEKSKTDLSPKNENSFGMSMLEKKIKCIGLPQEDRPEFPSEGLSESESSFEEFVSSETYMIGITEEEEDEGSETSEDFESTTTSQSQSSHKSKSSESERNSPKNENSPYPVKKAYDSMICQIERPEGYPQTPQRNETTDDKVSSLDEEKSFKEGQLMEPSPIKLNFDEDDLNKKQENSLSRSSSHTSMSSSKYSKYTSTDTSIAISSDRRSPLEIARAKRHQSDYSITDISEISDLLFSSTQSGNTNSNKDVNFSIGAQSRNSARQKTNNESLIDEGENIENDSRHITFQKKATKNTSKRNDSKLNDSLKLSFLDSEFNKYFDSSNNEFSFPYIQSPTSPRKNQKDVKILNQVSPKFPKIIHSPKGNSEIVDPFIKKTKKTKAHMPGDRFISTILDVFEAKGYQKPFNGFCQISFIKDGSVSVTSSSKTLTFNSRFSISGYESSQIKLTLCNRIDSMGFKKVSTTTFTLASLGETGEKWLEMTPIKNESSGSIRVFSNVQTKFDLPTDTNDEKDEIIVRIDVNDKDLKKRKNEFDQKIPKLINLDMTSDGVRQSSSTDSESEKEKEMLKKNYRAMVAKFSFSGTGSELLGDSGIKSKK
ncbi:hypothetical protein TRFO_05045 [Tritrichomonas foetus]|uniref:Uncharacterized protein n=1 Tax=Tritrichomonas foetus TaxID=1144522 RepID=A0A1J4K8V5_9EUKA|nr:hypothetical protein TRFO_05045 [Tritrichomonas foetus]|eukprot:OHT07929.1 hypothetical protein TRFO_05045 [Tritrichomonas foetus]